MLYCTQLPGNIKPRLRMELRVSLTVWQTADLALFVPGRKRTGSATGLPTRSKSSLGYTMACGGYGFDWPIQSMFSKCECDTAGKINRLRHTIPATIQMLSDNQNKILILFTGQEFGTRLITHSWFVSMAIIRHIVHGNISITLSQNRTSLLSTQRYFCTSKFRKSMAFIPY